MLYCLSNRVKCNSSFYFIMSWSPDQVTNGCLYNSNHCRLQGAAWHGEIMKVSKLDRGQLGTGNVETGASLNVARKF